MLYHALSCLPFADAKGNERENWLPMYEVDDKDKVIEIGTAPQSSVGAPNPMLLAGEHDLFLTYCTIDEANGWEAVAAVSFKRCSAHMFGPPNDEAFHGHPLANRGLKPYGIFEIKESSWIRGLERMNAVHPFHDKHRFMNDKKHFVFSFHDTTFECVAETFSVEVCTGSVKSVIRRLLETAR